MAIVVRCPRCGNRSEFGNELAGTATDCPRCGLRLNVPRLIPPVATEPAFSPTTEPVVASKEIAEPPLVAPGQKIDFEDLIDMTAMVDIVFFLLIFFLVTSMQALDSSIPLPAPDSQGARGGTSLSGAAADDSSVIVQIDKRDVIRIDDVDIHGPRELLFKLRELRHGSGQPDKLVVKASGDASHGTAVLVLDSARDAGFERIGLSVQEETE